MPHRHGYGFTTTGLNSGKLAADHSQSTQDEQDFKYNHLGPAVEKMIDNATADNDGNSRVNQYAEFAWNIHNICLLIQFKFNYLAP